MLALSLLLSATAGVNAMLGSDIKAVTISSTSYFCPYGCVFRGASRSAFFQSGGNWCRDNEIVILSSPDYAEELYACGGLNLEGSGWQEQPYDGPVPKCDVFQSTPTDPIACDSERDQEYGVGTKIVEWSELEKVLESAS